MKMSKSKLLYVTLASSLTIFATACGAKKTDSSNQTIKFSQNVPKKAIKKVGTLTKTNHLLLEFFSQKLLIPVPM